MAGVGSGRRYERGENRWKHVGTANTPEIVVTPNGERLGKCPSALNEERRQAMLDNAVAHIVTPPYSEAFPKRLYAVDIDGTIYAGETSNPGDSYHGYPYAGRMGKRLIAALRTIARRQNCETGFDKWAKRHIVIGGPPDL